MKPRWLSGQPTGLVVAILVLAALLAGCSAADSQRPGGGNGSVAAGDVPDFQGPWAAEFTSTYQAAQSDFVRSVLVDGAISDQEWAETRDRFTQCMSAFGISNVSFEDNGALSFDEPDGVDPDTVSDQTKQCSDDSGEAAVGSLHSWTRRNPEKQDENAIMAACLVRKGAVDPSYTADQYVKDLPDESFPFIAGSSGPAAFRECTLDPLGLFG